MLNLLDAPVTDAGLEILERMPKLRIMSLGGTKLSDTGLVHLEGLTGLQNLALKPDGGQRRRAGLIEEGLTRLRRLSLERTGVSDTALASLKAMSSLDELRLKGTRVSDAGVQELKRALPKTEISR